MISATLAPHLLRFETLLVWSITLFVLVISAPGMGRSGIGPDSRLSISGSVSADGHPAGGAVVELFRAGDAASVADISSSMLGNGGLTTGATDDQGAFKFDSVPRGAYRLEVSLPGFVVSSGTTEPTDGPVYYRPGDSVHIEMVKGGVVTGKVVDASGLPLAEVPVRAVRVKDAEGRPTFDIAVPDLAGSGQGWATDDRGIYRIFGLKGGSYLVSAGGAQRIVSQFGSDPYHSDAPTYYPSNPRSTAVEVPVHAGAEVVAIDITYQALTGHSISGALTGQVSAQALIDIGLVMLTNVSTGSLDSTGFAFGDSGGRNFSIKGVPDGQYYLTAIAGFGAKQITVSEPLKVAINGADVSGLSLTLAPLPEISGVVSFAPPPKITAESKCKPGPPTAEEIILKAVKEAGRGGRGLPELAKFFGSGAGSPDERGNFRVTLSSGGHYHIDFAFPGPQFYISSMKVAAQDKNIQPVDASSGVDVKMGEKRTGLSIVVGTDGASIAGKVTSTKKSEPLPIDLAIMMVPVEPDLSNNLLRYAEVLAAADGTFEIANLAPGKYFVLVRRLGEREWNDPDRQPSYWDARRRKDLLTEAKNGNLLIELKQCENREKYLVAYPQVSSSKVEGPSGPRGATH